MTFKEMEMDVKWSLGLMVAVGAFLISTTWFVAKVYFEFGQVQGKIQHMEQLKIITHKELEEADIYTNDRLDKKTKRNEDRITELEKEIEKLKLKGSDAE